MQFLGILWLIQENNNIQKCVGMKVREGSLWPEGRQLYRLTGKIKLG